MKNVLYNIESEPGKRKLYAKNAQQLLLLYLLYKTLSVLWTYFKPFTLKYLSRLRDLIYDNLYYIVHYF